MNIPTELYREVDEAHEFRGEGYFNAAFAGNKTEWFYATPPSWRFAVYPGDHWILKDIGNGDFVIMAGQVSDGRWGVPLPDRHSDHEYRVFRQYLKDISPRMELS